MHEVYLTITKGLKLPLRYWWCCFFFFNFLFPLPGKLFGFLFLLHISFLLSAIILIFHDCLILWKFLVSLDCVGDSGFTN